MCNVNLTKYVGKHHTYEINKQKQEIENKNNIRNKPKTNVTGLYISIHIIIQMPTIIKRNIACNLTGIRGTSIGCINI